MEVRKSLVVNSTPLETRIALLENGQLCELFLERTMNKSQVGDVYKGRVAKLLPGMQSAFVNIGGIKDGFLYLDDPATPRLGVGPGLRGRGRGGGHRGSATSATPTATPEGRRGDPWSRW